MRVVIAGASGFLGHAWHAHLQQSGHEVVRLVRHTAGSGESSWDPYAGKIDQEVIDNADVVATLSGAGLAHFPWTKRYREVFTQSRLATTKTLAEAIARSPRPAAFLAQNGIAGYGDRGDALVTEATATDADTFMGEVTRRWQASTEPAAQAGSRVVTMRTAVVLDASGGALKAMLLPFRLGLGGRIGNGRQYFATISLRDWVRAATWLAESGDAAGPYNLTGPMPTTNADFTRELGQRLRRPTALPLPAFVPKLLVPPIASELLNSTRVEPARLLTEGFDFEHPTLAARLDAALAR